MVTAYKDCSLHYSLESGAIEVVNWLFFSLEVVTAYKAAMKGRDLNDSDADDSPNGSVHDLMTPQNAEVIEMVRDKGRMRYINATFQ